ncbi:MAG: NAD(P)H-binding protein [Woeseiaceae bacterium]|nr:NAD(P)H-binding protein [Woeseiaceae bacterium]
MKAWWLAALALFACAAQPQEPRPGLQILVYGATGSIGTHIVDEALARGHLVTAVSRDPTRITKQHPNLAAVAGDLLDPESVGALVAGKDVVVTSVRGVIGERKSGEDSLQYLAVVNVTEQLRALGDGSGRLIHVGGAGSLEVAEGKLFADRLPKLFMSRALKAEIEGQVLALEYLRDLDDVAWSYATPPRTFTDGPRTGNFRVGGDRFMEDRRGKSRISRADFAVAVLDEAELERHTGKRFSVAY